MVRSLTYLVYVFTLALNVAREWWQLALPLLTSWAEAGKLWKRKYSITFDLSDDRHRGDTEIITSRVEETRHISEDEVESEEAL